MRNAKKFSLILAFIFLITIIPDSFAGIVTHAAFEPSCEVQSNSVYMVNMDTDICVYSKNEFDKCYPASTTKIMTCLLTLKNIQSMKDKVKVTYDCFNEFSNGDPNKEGPSAAAIEIKQDNLTYKDCLYALMLASACEAANILAYNVGGNSIENFVKMMNDEAAELGCVNTHFSNAHGLFEENNYSCAYDMYLISKYAYETFPEFMEICSAYSYDMPANTYNPDGYTITSTNKLMQNNSDNEFYYEYASGIKTGSFGEYYLADGTSEKGIRCLVSTASKDGFTYMLVTLNGPYYDKDGEPVQSSFADHVALYKWAFSTFSYKTILSSSDIVTEVQVAQGENADHISLKPAKDYSTLLPSDLDETAIQRVIKSETDLCAPIEDGAVLGSIELKLNGETLTKVDLIANGGIERSQFEYIKSKIQRIIDTGWFKACVAVLAVLIVAAIVVNSIARAQKRSMAKKKFK